MPRHLLYDAKHALRGLLRDRAFTLVALLSIGLGVGANSAIFSLVDQALFRNLPVKDPERLVLLNWSGSFIGSGGAAAISIPTRSTAISPLRIRSSTACSAVIRLAWICRSRTGRSRSMPRCRSRTCRNSNHLKNQSLIPKVD